MALGSVKDNELNKFFETSNGEAAVRIGGSGTVIDGIVYDSINATYPTTSSEVYKYFTGGLSGTLVATVTVIYNSTSKVEITSVVRS